MKCPNCGYEYFSEDLEKCPACGASLLDTKLEFARRKAETQETEAKTPATLANMKEINRKLDRIASGVDFLVIVVVVSLLLSLGILVAFVI